MDRSDDEGTNKYVPTSAEMRALREELRWVVERGSWFPSDVECEEDHRFIKGLLLGSISGEGQSAAPLPAGQYHRIAWRERATGVTGRGEWSPADSRILLTIRDLNAGCPGAHHWLEAKHVAEGDSSPGRLVERRKQATALSDDALSREIALALSLPPLRYATAWADVQDMEEALPQERRAAYVRELAHLTRGPGEGLEARWGLARATPRQRCIAAILALGEG